MTGPTTHPTGPPRSGPAPRIGVVDSGWASEIAHARVSAVTDFVPPEPVSTRAGRLDLLGHGSACAELILSVTRTSLITPIRIFGRRLRSSPRVLFEALEWAVDQRFDLLNLSLATTSASARDPLYLLCHRLLDAGTIVIAAAENSTGSGYPAVFANAIGVGLAGLTRGVRGRGDQPTVDVLITPSAVRRSSPRRTAAPSTSIATAMVTGFAGRILETRGPQTIESMRDALHQDLGSAGALPRHLVHRR